MNMQAEYIEEYLVDEKHKKIWAVEIEILKEIIRICDKYDISYFAYGGTLLGAIRHAGFIPWDDDMDIAMLRSEYERFIKVAEKEIDKSRFFLQKSEVLGEVYEGFARLRYTNSTAIIYKDRHKNCNHGIFIDIFPLDNIPNEEKKLQVLRKKAYFYSALIFYKTYPETAVSHRKIAKVISAIKSSFLWKHINLAFYNTCTQYGEVGCDRVGILSCDPYDEKCYWYRDDIEKTIEVPFEDFTIKVPVGYERCLRIGYGDFMKYPPVEERGNWHSSIFFDPYKPYTEYHNKDILFQDKVG